MALENSTKNQLYCLFVYLYKFISSLKILYMHITYSISSYPCSFYIHLTTSLNIVIQTSVHCLSCLWGACMCLRTYVSVCLCAAVCACVCVCVLLYEKSSTQNMDDSPAPTSLKTVTCSPEANCSVISSPPSTDTFSICDLKFTDSVLRRPYIQSNAACDFKYCT